MEITASTEKWLGGLSAIASGVLAWEYQATSKLAAGFPAGQWPSAWTGGYSLFSKIRFGDALAGLVGNGNVKQVFGPSYNGVGDFHPNPFGWVNKTVGVGIVLRAADYILSRVWGLYDKLDGVPAVVRGISTGLIAGGGLGGVFDPDIGGFTAVSTVTGPSGGGVATGNVPYTRGEAAMSRQISVLA
jgi:hypothetical protein